MSAQKLVVLASVVLLAAPEVGYPAGPPARGRVDQYGDPLPAGAIARLGTVRLRHHDAVSSVLFSRDGKTIITAASHGGGFERPRAAVRFWGAATGKLVRSFAGQPSGPHQLALSPDGNVLASVSADSERVWLWDMRTGRTLHRLRPSRRQDQILAAAFSPDGKTLATCGTSFQLWDVRTGKCLREFGGKVGGWRLAYSPDGKTIGLLDEPGVRLWDPAAGKEIWRYPMDSHSDPHPIAFSPDGTVVVTGGEDGVICFLSARAGKEVRQLAGHKGPLHALAFSPDGKALASGGKDGIIRLWDTRNGKELRQLLGHVEPVDALAFSPDGKVLASGGSDYRVRLWDVATGKEGFRAAGHRSFVEALAFCPTGKALASGDFEGAVRLWDLPIAKERWHFAEYRKDVTAIKFSPDGKHLAWANSRTVRLCDKETGKKKRRFTGHRGTVYSLSFAHGGKVLTSAGNDGTIRVWDLCAGKELRRQQTKGMGKGVLAQAFSPDGRLLASGGGLRADTIVLLDVRTGKEVRRLVEYDDVDVSGVSFSPDGRTLAAASEQGTVRFWDVRNGERRGCLTAGPEARFTCVAFAPDGRTLTTGDKDGIVRVWEVASGQEVWRLRGHTDDVNCVAFAPGGRTLASGSRDFTILLWDVTGLLHPGAPPARSLTPTELERLWKMLAGGRARPVRLALWRMAASPREVVPFLQKRLRPVPVVPAGRIGWLLADLDADRFEVREKAAAELEALGEVAVPHLRKLLEGRPSPEARKRSRRVLQKLERPVALPRRLRETRAVEALEHMGTAEARALLKSLAGGAPEARLTQEARAALRRLEGRPGAP